MSEQSNADSDIPSMQRRLKNTLVEVCKAEQRSRWLDSLVRKRLLPKDVRNFILKQFKQQRAGRSRGMDQVFNSGRPRLMKKLRDNKLVEMQLRKRRDKERNDLECVMSGSGFVRMMKSMRSHVEVVRTQWKNKYLKKTKDYLAQRELDEASELSTLQEELGEFGKLRIFSGVSIPPEERKPPVTTKEVELSKYEIEVLSKNPKFAVRAMMSKEKFMVEVEKGMCKKLFGDIGKEIVDGKTVVEVPSDDEEKRVMKEAEWQDRKSQLVYDFEQKDLDFGRLKATEMKNNKRITLPKASSIQVEALMEVRRKRASQLYDMCVRKLGEECESGKDNLTMGERRGLKSLKKRVANDEIVVCQTDKSGRFCVLTKEQYVMAGNVHAEKDRRIDLDEHGEVERALNGHMRWWNSIWSLGSHWSQEDRCLRNLLNHGLGACPMTLLMKDHKPWEIIPKSRSVMGGNEGGNTGISEFLSMVLEPVAGEQSESMEINATNGLLADIFDLNKALEKETAENPTNEEFSIREEELSTLVEQWSSSNEEISSHEEECDMTSKEGTSTTDHTARGGADRTLPLAVTDRNQSDIRQFLKAGNHGPSFVKSVPDKLDEPFDKMRMIRNKMSESRRMADKEDAKLTKVVEPPVKLWKGEKVVYARDVDNALVQDHGDLVVVGADVEALYPSLVDVEIANLCYNAIMKSNISFSNINYRRALLYLAITMNKTDQRTSPLWRVLPRRTSGGGVRPGVTASPENEKHWFFPKVELTDLEKRMVVAMVVKVGVLVMMNTHVYAWNGGNSSRRLGGQLASAVLARLPELS